MEFLNKYKKTLTILFGVVLCLYFGFLFVLPNVVNINNYKKDIQKIVFDVAKLNIDFDSIKIVTTPSLKAGINAKGLKLFYPGGKDIVTLKEGEVKLSLLPLLLAKVQVSDVFVDAPILNVSIMKNGQIDVVDYIMKNISTVESSAQAPQQELPIKISDKLPTVLVKNYVVSVFEEKSNNTIAINGESFVFDNAVLNKHLRVGTKGAIFLNDISNINYDIQIKSFWPVLKTSTQDNVQAQELPQIDIVKELVKFNPSEYFRRFGY